MEIKQFVQKVITDVLDAVQGCSDSAVRTVILASKGDKRTIEFDIAVSAEEGSASGGKGGVKVLSFELGANTGIEQRNSTVSRVTFGVEINTLTKEEEKKITSDHYNLYNNE